MYSATIKSEDYYDLIFKTVIIGDSGVGKSNLLSRYLNDIFCDDQKATIGVEFGSKKLTIEGKTIKAQIWDTAGQERYRSITNAYYKGAKGAFIVFDITCYKSFESVDKWYRELKAEGDLNIFILLIGNKSDLDDDRKVSNEEAKLKAEGLSNFLNLRYRLYGNISKR